jgi:hypothetical protein
MGSERVWLGSSRKLGAHGGSCGSVFKMNSSNRKQLKLSFINEHLECMTI